MQTNSHLSRLIHDQAEKYGDREVLIYKDFGGSEWKSYSWNQFSDMVKRVSNALLNLGVKYWRVLTELCSVSLLRLWCVGCPRCHHPLLCHQLRTADPVYDQRREDKIPLRG